MLLRDDETIPTRRKLALGLLRQIARDLRTPYGIFFTVTLFVSASSFLLPQYFLIFTENAARISEISIQEVLSKLMRYGLVVAAALGVTTFFSIYMREWFQLKVERYLRTKILARLHSFSITEIDRVQRGNWLTSVTDDLRVVERFISESLPNQVRALFVVLGTGVLFVYYSHAMAAVPIVACGIIAALNVWVQRKIAPLMDEIRGLHGDVIQSLLQSVEGIKTVRSYGAERDQVQRFGAKLAEVEKKGRRVARTFGVLLGSNDAATQALTTLSLTFIMVTLAKDEMTLAAALAYPFYLNLFYSSAESLASAALDWNEFFISGGRFAEIAHMRGAAGFIAESADEPAMKSAERVELSKITYGFNSARPLQVDFDFSCERGEIVVLTGASGVGKSTFLEVLSGIRPAFAGRWHVRASSISGWGASFGEASLPLELTSYVEQKPYIFEGRILDNLLLGDEKGEAEVWAALTEANLKQFVDDNGGLDYVLQDGGQNLSEGQRYRLALARALLKDRPFLLLDEPFASLDQLNVELIAETLQNCKQNRGIILVTHVIPRGLTPHRVVDFATVTPALIETIPQPLEDLRIEW